MFEFTIVAFVAVGLTALIAYAASKPSLKEIKESSKKESYTSDLPFNEDFPVVEPKPIKKQTKKTKKQ